MSVASSLPAKAAESDERVALGEPDRLLGVRGRAVELPADELECLSAVQGREDLLGIADLLAQAKRTFEYPLKFGRRVSLGRNQRRDKCQAELVLDPCTLAESSMSSSSARPRSKCDIASRLDDSRVERCPAFSQ